ncbi:hypothetical protein CkaCkLH20_11360 [Colletotrichum karsti]|uniref:Uncharacterized protein n=1 Tax=Colletotrichum karsti TaxID=1095194 RepID=A0A9P6HZE2_9PEZI|nr:uncharacterized protein CkaCkLH20_11360 [Colletotrichum karsti]KAF9871191.1 hypothetical protein CkaCkLH20_11360 [Colletotrichum karsti]
MFSAKSFLCAALAATVSFTGVQAQIDTTADIPLDIDGAFEGASADTTDFNTGGTIRCNGQTVVVPQNLQITFPAAFIPFKDFVASYKTGNYGNYQCSITGNIVGGIKGRAIAAQISIAQFATTTASGYITDVANNGEIKVNVGTGSVTLRINDPNAVYSVGNAGITADPFFTADDQNPSISSFSGFPMCVPRSSADPLCPSSNRPLIGNSKQGSVKVPDWRFMAPFVPGDFITFSGYESGAIIMVYNLVAFNIQLTTAGTPNFIRMEDANIGVWTADTVNQEVAQTKFVGYSSEGTGTAKIQAIDYDKCTGAKNLRDIASLPIPGTEPRNKFEYRVTQPTQVKYAREYYISTSAGTKTNNGILAGTYVMPVSEWIQPEDSVPGRPPTGHDFSQYQWLTDGLGADDKGDVWGPLNPFPQSNVKTNGCSTTTPPAGSGGGSGGSTGGGSSGGSSGGTSTPSKDVVAVVGVPTWVSSKSGTIGIQCNTTYTLKDTLVNMKVSFQNVDGTTSGMSMTAAGNGLWTYTQSKVKNPATSVTCVSDLGGIGTWKKP